MKNQFIYYIFCFCLIECFLIACGGDQKEQGPPEYLLDGVSIKSANAFGGKPLKSDSKRMYNAVLGERVKILVTSNVDHAIKWNVGYVKTGPTDGEYGLIVQDTGYIKLQACYENTSLCTEKWIYVSNKIEILELAEEGVATGAIDRIDHVGEVKIQPKSNVHNAAIQSKTKRKEPIPTTRSIDSQEQDSDDEMITRRYPDPDDELIQEKEMPKEEKAVEPVLSSTEIENAELPPSPDDVVEKPKNEKKLILKNKNTILNLRGISCLKSGVRKESSGQISINPVVDIRLVGAWIYTEKSGEALFRLTSPKGVSYTTSVFVNEGDSQLLFSDFNVTLGKGESWTLHCKLEDGLQFSNVSPCLKGSTSNDEVSISGSTLAIFDLEYNF